MLHCLLLGGWYGPQLAMPYSAIAIGTAKATNVSSAAGLTVDHFMPPWLARMLASYQAN
jgi:hypothetical protein